MKYRNFYNRKMSEIYRLIAREYNLHQLTQMYKLSFIESQLKVKFCKEEIQNLKSKIQNLKHYGNQNRGYRTRF
jgi:hypothetical protein